MTLRAMTHAWVSDLPPAEKLVLLAWADNFGEMPFSLENAFNVAEVLTGIPESMLNHIFNALYVGAFIQPCVSGEWVINLESSHSANPGNYQWEAESPITMANSNKSGRSKYGRAGFVYLLRNMVDPSIFKIGRSKDPDNRMETFKLTLPFRVEFEHIIECDDMYILERELHQRFDNQRAEGEWFELNADDVTYIKSLGGTS